jgi:hypothetical protein
VTRQPGLCGLHDGAREEAMYVVGQPNGDQWWFCEVTQQLTRGAAAL